MELVAILFAVPSALAVVVGFGRWLWLRRDHDDLPVPTPATPIATAAAPATPRPPGWGDRPATLGDRLFGRAADLDAIDVAFEQYRWVVLAGGAGAGKSQLAAEWTQRAPPPATERLGRS